MRTLLHWTKTLPLGMILFIAWLNFLFKGPCPKYLVRHLQMNIAYTFQYVSNPRSDFWNSLDGALCQGRKHKLFISNNAVIANLSSGSMRPLSRVKKMVESQNSDDFGLDESNNAPSKSNTPATIPRGAVEQKMLEQILEMISSNKYNEEVISEIKNLLSEDGNGTVGNLVDIGA